MIADFMEKTKQSSEAKSGIAARPVNRRMERYKNGAVDTYVTQKIQVESIASVA